MSMIDEPLFSDPLSDTEKTPTNDTAFSNVSLDLRTPRVPAQTPAPVPQSTPPPSFPDNLEGTGFYDPIDGAQPEPGMDDAYRNFKLFEQQYRQAEAIKKDSDRRVSQSKDLLELFYQEEVQPTYSKFYGEHAGEVYTGKDRVGYLQDMSNEVDMHGRRVAEADDSFLGNFMGDSDAVTSSRKFLSGENPALIKSLREKEARLLEEQEIHNTRKLKSDIFFRNFQEKEASFGSLFKAQADVWARNAKSRASAMAEFDPLYGDVKGQGVPKRGGKSERQWKTEYLAAQKLLDAKYKDVDPWSGVLDRSSLTHKERVNNRKRWQKILDDRNENSDLLAQGGVVSRKGMYGGHPIGFNAQERHVLDLDALRKAGIEKYKGEDIQTLIDSDGGEEKVFALNLASASLKAHSVYTELGIEAFKEGNWGKEGHEGRMQAMEIARAVWHDSLKKAESVGLGNDIVRRKPSSGFLGGILNVARELYGAGARGYANQKANDMSVMRLMSGDGGFDEATIDKIIEAGKAELKHPKSKELTNYLAHISENPSEDLFEASKKFFSKDPSVFLKVGAELFTESMAQFLPATFRNMFTAEGVGSGIGFAFLESIITKNPKSLSKHLGRALKYDYIASTGIASFQLSYVAQVLEDLGEMGVDIHNPKHFLTAWSNPEIQARLRKRAEGYAGGVALFDLLSAGIAGQVSKLFSKPAQIAGKTKNGSLALVPFLKGSSELAVGSALGMGGEASGHYLKQYMSGEYGEPLPYDDIFLEGALEFGPGAISAGKSLFIDPVLDNAWKSTTPRKKSTSPAPTTDEIKVESEPVADPESQGTSTQVVTTPEGDTAERIVLTQGDYSSLEKRLKLAGAELKKGEMQFISTFLDTVVRPVQFDPSDFGIVISNSDDPRPGKFSRSKDGTVTLTINPKVINASNVSVSDILIHETAHFAEYFLMDEDVISKSYDSLTYDQKVKAMLDYASFDSPVDSVNNLTDRQKAVFDSLVQSEDRARSEWLAFQIARVIRDETANMDSGLVNAIKKALDIIRDILVMAGGEDVAPGKKGDEARKKFDDYILKSMNFRTRSSLENAVTGKPTPAPTKPSVPKQEPTEKPKPKPQKASSEAEPKATAETKKPDMPEKSRETAKKIVKKGLRKGEDGSQILNRLKKESSNQYNEASYVSVINEVMAESKGPPSESKPKKPAKKSKPTKEKTPKKASNTVTRTKESIRRNFIKSWSAFSLWAPDNDKSLTEAEILAVDKFVTEMVNEGFSAEEIIKSARQGFAFNPSHDYTPEEISNITGSTIEPVVEDQINKSIAKAKGVKPEPPKEEPKKKEEEPPKKAETKSDPPKKPSKAEAPKEKAPKAEAPKEKAPKEKAPKEETQGTDLGKATVSFSKAELQELVDQGMSVKEAKEVLIAKYASEAKVTKTTESSEPKLTPKDRGLELLRTLSPQEALIQLIEEFKLSDEEAVPLFQFLLDSDPNSLGAPLIPSSLDAPNSEASNLLSYVNLARITNSQSRPLKSFLKDFLPKIQEKILNGYYFKYDPEHPQFRISDDDTISFASDDKGSFSNESPEIESFNKWVEDRKKTVEALKKKIAEVEAKQKETPTYEFAGSVEQLKNDLHEAQAYLNPKSKRVAVARESLLNDLSFKNLAVALLNPEIFNDIDPEVNQKDVSVELKNQLKKADDLFQRQEAFKSVLHDFRTVLEAKLYSDSKQPDLSFLHSEKNAWEVFEALGLAEGLDAKSKEEKKIIFAKMNKGYFVNPLTKEVRAEASAERDVVKVDEKRAKKFLLSTNGSEGLDNYIAEVSSSYGIPVRSSMFYGWEKVQTREKRTTTESIREIDYDKIDNRSISEASTFMARLTGTDRVWGSDEKSTRRLKRWLFSTMHSDKAVLGDFTKSASPNRFIGFTDSLPDIPDDIKSSLEEVSIFHNKSGKPVVPNKFPVNPELGHKLFFFLQQFQDRKSTFDLSRLMPSKLASIYVSDEKAWYHLDQNFKFSKSRVLPKLPTHKGSNSATIIASNGSFQHRQDFPLDIKVQIEGLFERTFPAVAERKFSNRNIELGMDVDSDFNPRFFINYKEGDEKSYESINGLNLIRSLLSRLDVLPTRVHENKYIPSSTTLERILSSGDRNAKENARIEKARGFHFSGLTVGAGLLDNYGGKPWSAVTESVRRDLNRSRTNYQPTMLEYFYSFPEMPSQFTKKLERDLDRKKKYIENLAKKFKESQSAYEQAEKEYKEKTKGLNSNDKKSAHFSIVSGPKNKYLADSAKLDIANSEKDNIADNLLRIQEIVDLFSKDGKKVDRSSLKPLLNSIETPEIKKPLLFSAFNEIKRAFGDRGMEFFSGDRSDEINDIFPRLQNIVGDSDDGFNSYVEPVEKKEFGGTTGSDEREPLVTDFEYLRDKIIRKSRESTKGAESSSALVNDYLRRIDFSEDILPVAKESVVVKFATELAKNPKRKVEILKDLKEAAREVYLPMRGEELAFAVLQLARIESGEALSLAEYNDIYEKGRTYAEKSKKESSSGERAKLVEELNSIEWELGGADKRMVVEVPEKVIDGKKILPSAKPTKYASLLARKHKILRKLGVKKGSSAEIRLPIRKGKVKIKETGEYADISSDERINNILARPAKFPSEAVSESNLQEVMASGLSEKDAIHAILGIIPIPKGSLGKQIDTSGVAGRIFRLRADNQDELTATLQARDMLSLARRIAKLERLSEEGILGGPDADRRFHFETLVELEALFGSKGVSAWWDKTKLSDFLRKIDPNWEAIERADARGDRTESVSEEGAESTMSTMHNPYDQTKADKDILDPDTVAYLRISGSPATVAGIERFYGRRDRAFIEKVSKPFSETFRDQLYSRWITEQELKEMGVKSRDRDPILDKRIYLKPVASEETGSKTLENEERDFVIEQSPITQAIDEYVKIGHRVFMTMSEEMPTSPELITLFGDRPGMKMTRREVQRALRRMDKKEDIRGELKSKDVTIEVIKKIQARKKLSDELASLSDDFVKAEQRLQTVSSGEGFFLTPQLLAASLWNSGISAGVQLNPSVKKDASGFLPYWENDGFDAFFTDKEATTFMKKDMEFRPLRNYIFLSVGGKLKDKGFTKQEVQEAYDRFSGRSPDLKINSEKIAPLVADFEKLGIEGFSSKHGMMLKDGNGKPITFKEIRKRLMGEMTSLRYKTSAYSGNTPVLNDGGLAMRTRMNTLPAEVYLSFIDELLKKPGVDADFMRDIAMVLAKPKSEKQINLRDGDVVFGSGEQDSSSKGGKARFSRYDATTKTFKPVDSLDLLKNKDGSWNIARLQQAFIYAFNNAYPKALSELNELDYDAKDASKTSLSGMQDVNADFVDVLSVKAQEKRYEQTTEDPDNTSSELSAPAIGQSRRAGFERLVNFYRNIKSDLHKAFTPDGAREKFRRNEDLRRSFFQRIKSGFHAGIVNSYYELEEMNELMIQDLKKRGKVQSEDLDALRFGQRIRTYMGKTGVALDEARAEFEVPFMEKLAEVSHSDPLKFVGDYWYARFAPLRNAYIRKKRREAGMPLKDENGKEYGSGMTDLEASEIIAKTKMHSDFKKIQEITKEFDRMNKNNLKILVAGEVLTKDQYNRLVKAATNKDGEFVWAPLRGFENTEIEGYPTDIDSIADIVHRDEVQGGQGTGEGFSQTGSRLALTAAFGRTDRAEPHEIWGQSFGSYIEAIARANKNKEASTALLDLLREIEKDPKLKEEWGHIFDIADPTDPEFQEKFGATKNFGYFKKDPKTGEEEFVFDQTAVNPLDANKNVFTVRREGKPVFIVFKGSTGERLASALMNRGNVNLPAGMRLLRMTSVFFSGLYTVWNVDFIFTNFIRDVLSGYLNLKSDSESTSYAKNILSPRSLASNIKAMWKVSSRRRQGKPMASVLSAEENKFLTETLAMKREDITKDRLDKLFSNPLMASIAMQKSGGKVEFFGMIDVETKTRDIFGSIKRFQDKGTPTNYRNAFRRIFDFVNDVNTGVENAVRIEAFKQMVLAGESFQKAAFKGAREGTVDFNRKGNYTNVMNALFPFFGAGVAGNARLIKALTTGSTEGKREFQLKLAFGIVKAGLLYSFAMRLYAGDDEETEEQHWDRLSSWEKKHSVNLFFKPGGDGARVALALPYGWNLLWGLGSTLADLISSKAGFTDKEYGVAEASAEAVSGLIDTFHPMSSGSGFQRAIPHIVRPAFEIATNQNFLSNPIMPERSDWDPYEKPDSELYFRSVNPISKDLTSMMNRLSGGSEFEAGMFDISPETIDHLVGYYLGTMGRQLHSMAGASYSTIKGEKSSLDLSRSIPVYSRLIKNETSDIHTKQRFYSLSKIIGSKISAHKALEKRGDRLGAKELKRNNPKIFKISGMIDAYDKKTSALKRLIDKKRKAGVSNDKIQLLEEKLQNEKIKGMSSVLKNARELGIKV